MSLTKELSQRLNEDWMFREDSNNDVVAYYRSQRVVRIAANSAVDAAFVELLKKCERIVTTKHVNETLRRTLIECVMTGKQTDRSMLVDGLNTFERNLILSYANAGSVLITLGELLPQCTPADGEPCTYDTVVIHVLARRLLELSMPSVPSKAEQDVLAERKKQRSRYGNTQDDIYTDNELSRVAACLAYGNRWLGLNDRCVYPRNWTDGFFTDNHRTNCVKAAALLIAEIERQDRAALCSETKKG